MSTTATIFIVDDDPAVQQSLRMLFRSVGFRTEVFNNGQQFLDAFDDQWTGCVVLDMRMPGMSGLELQQQLNQRQSIMPVIFMTGHGDVPMAVEAMQAGAIDFIQKPFNDQELIDRVTQAVAKDTRNREVLNEKNEIRQRLNSLTPREHEILDMVVNGKANKVIADDLELSQRTVEIHRARVMEKMQATSLAHLVRMVIAADTSENSDVGVTRLTRA
ncbi:MAG TPA: response regulator FixJ [Steroidobacteraceae bacterium]|nr:response regulator FixJ [Steroidobacteraceae bacterium]